MSSLGGLVTAWGGDPKFNKLALVKNQAIADAATGLLGAENSNAKANQNTLAKWSSKFLGLSPQREAATAEEVGAVGGLYNGDLARSLSGGQAQFSKALDNAINGKLAQARVGNKLSALRSGGGDSGYLRNLDARSMAPILAEGELAKANMSRDDARYLTSMQMAGLGKRNALLDATAMDELTPMQVANAEVGRRTGVLGGLTSIDEANTLYGAQKHRTGLDKWGDFLGSLGSVVMDAASIYSGTAGMGGGSKAPPKSGGEYGLGSWGGGDSGFGAGSYA